MPVNKARGQTAGNLKVLFKVLDSSGTPSIVNVSPSIAAGDISVADTAQGRATVTIKNFKGPQGAYNIQLTTHLIHVWSSVAASSDSYSGNDLTFEITTTDDAHAATDASVDVCVEAY